MSQVQPFGKIFGQWRPECAICRKPVSLEESKADEYGQAIHEECYLSKLTRNKSVSVFHNRWAQDSVTMLRSASARKRGYR